MTTSNAPAPSSTPQPKTALRGQTALITGATAGIGLACAEQLASRGCHLILTGRRVERLSAIKARLSSEFGVDVATLSFDLSSRKETEAAIAGAQSQLAKLSILINNAGLALGTDPVSTAKLDDWDGMVDTNLKGLLYVTRLCLPFLQAQQNSHVVNIGSVAGRWTYPGGAVYCATKFAVRGFSEALRMDLMGKGVRVTNIEPGMVETEFSLVRLKNAEKARAVYSGLEALSASDIAESVAWCLERPAHVNIQELVIYPTDQAGVGPAYTFRR